MHALVQSFFSNVKSLDLKDKYTSIYRYFVIKIFLHNVKVYINCTTFV